MSRLILCGKWIIVILVSTNLLFITKFIWICLLLLVGWYDRKYRRIPNRLLIGMIAAGGIRILLSENFAGACLGAVSVSGWMALVCLIRPGAFGGGDIKLMAVCGAVMGWRQACAGIVFALLLAGVRCVRMLSCAENRNAELALGPYLAAGLLLAEALGDMRLIAIWSAL